MESTAVPERLASGQAAKEAAEERSLVALRLSGSSQYEMLARLDQMSGQMAVMKQFFQKPGMMEKGVDYGYIPGVPKPVLFKSGAEKLVNLFGWRIAISKVDEAYDADCGFYRARVEVGLVTRDGEPIGVGTGEANSNEGRFRWRWVGDRDAPAEATRRGVELKDLPKRRSKFGKWDEYRMDNEDPWALWNTVLKHAKKRALLDVVMASTRATGLFSRSSGIESWLNEDDRDPGDEDEQGPPRDVTPPTYDHPNALWKKGDDIPHLVQEFDNALGNESLGRGHWSALAGTGWQPDRVLNWFESTGYSVAEAVTAVKEFAAAGRKS